jgi:hypothetical protein
MCWFHIALAAQSRVSIEKIKPQLSWQVCEVLHANVGSEIKSLCVKRALAVNRCLVFQPSSVVVIITSIGNFRIKTELFFYKDCVFILPLPVAAAPFFQPGSGFVGIISSRVRAFFNQKTDPLE